MAFKIDLRGEDRAKLDIELVHINGIEFNSILDDAFKKNVKRYLNNKFINLDEYYDQENDKYWDEARIKITSYYKDKSKKITDASLIINSKYTQKKGFDDEIRKTVKREGDDVEVEYILDLKREEWSGPINGYISFGKNNKEIIKTGLLSIYPDDREAPSLASGLFIHKTNNFETDEAADSQWKKILLKMKASNVLTVFELPKHSEKKITLWTNNSFEGAVQLLKNIKNFIGKNRGIASLLFLAEASGPFSAYLAEMIFEMRGTLSEKRDGEYNDSNLYEDLEKAIEANPFLSISELKPLVEACFPEESPRQAMIKFWELSEDKNSSIELHQRANIALQQNFNVKRYIGNSLKDNSPDGNSEVDDE